MTTQIIESDQTKVFRALKNEIRRDMIHELINRDLSPGDFEAFYELSPAAITKHLKILEEAGFILRYREGKRTMCKLNTWRLKALKLDWLGHFLL